MWIFSKDFKQFISSKTYDLIIIIIGIIFLVVSNFDLSISNYLYNPNSFLGILVQKFGETPGFLFIIFSFEILLNLYEFKTKDRKLAFETFSFIVIWGLEGYIWYVIIKLFTNNFLIPLIILSLISLFLIHYLFGFIRKLNLNKEYKSILIDYSKLGIIFSAIYSLIFVDLVKFVWGRARYRDIIHHGLKFTPWYIPNGVTGNVSFPSGHESTAMILLPLIGLLWELGKYQYNNFNKKNYSALILNLLICLWIIIVALGRIIAGAHFFSDVTFSIISGLILFKLIMIKNYHKTKIQ